VAVIGVVCAVGLSAGRLSGEAAGQVVVTSPLPAPAGAAALPAPPAPIDFAPLPTFEVASVKKLPKPATSTSSRSGGGRLVYTNVPLRTLMMLAWGIRDYQIIDGPGWLTTDRFSVNAKAETNAPRDQVLLMLRALLVERFNLKFRADKRELPTYVLVLPGKEWKPSEHMKPCTPRPVTVTPALAAAAAAAGVTLPANAVVQGAPAAPSAQKPQATPATPALPQCGTALSSVSTGLNLTGTTATLASLLGSLSGLGLVHDRTGLTGTYQFRLDSSVIDGRLSAAVPTAGDSLLPNVSAGGSITSAIQDLGLKLERRKEPVDVLVIESVSHPDED
jgi:uncharacterized protein (TIGR03435 family)